MIAADIMTRDVVTLRPECTVLEAMQLLIERQISGAPVVGELGELVGLVTEQDLMMVLQSFVEGWQEARLSECRALAASLQAERLVTVAAETAVEQISTLMIQKRIKRIPVVLEGRLVGIVSRRDILRWLLQCSETPRAPFRRPV